MSSSSENLPASPAAINRTESHSSSSSDPISEPTPLQFEHLTPVPDASPAGSIHKKNYFDEKPTTTTTTTTPPANFSSSDTDDEKREDDDDDYHRFRAGTLSPALSRASYRSSRSGYSKRDIYGDTPDEQIALERAKTIEQVVSRVTTHRHIDDVVPEETENGLPDDGEQFVDIDPELVTWEGDDDPENPRNWPKKKKWVTTIIVAVYTFISPLASSIIAPAVTNMSENLHVTKDIEKSLTVSIFVLAWAICPLFVAPLSEVFGRRVVLNIAIVLMTIFNMACALSQNIAQLLVFRFLAGCAGAPPLSIGAGTMADLFNDRERNTALALYAVGPTVGPVVAPIISGFIAENTTWRWVLWVLTIFNGVIAVLGCIFYRETYAPVLLQWKAARLRKETGNEHLHTVFEITKEPFLKQLYTAVTRPLRLLMMHPVVQGLGLYMAFVYGFMYLMLVTFPALWTEKYGFSLGIAGLMYLSLGIGFCLGLWFWAWIIQWAYLKLTERNGGVAKPEYRIPMAPLSGVCLGIGLLWYGWSAQAQIMWLMPCIGTGIFAFGIVAVFQCIQNYLIDMNPRFSASSMASAQVFRSFLGFGFPLFGKAMYDKLGYGWANTISGLLCFVLGIPFPIFVYIYGERLRNWANKKFT
ncbi:uncharacterized protein SAPINGB_P006288 [Magnusiomyces paraingens]|uniref:Major facilitator superfamily (MFS) profile domain-containing protein n=1 Tax=Magnusiomyces paraingens TaxID=2606893 RepID=A0A5E8CBA3_9ASCO|nr:uncharacterized protein SAPINGB_P006288 [Saprochaete ingens]VVT58596.1 unnamed protein product [Saprochaete ingens]